MIASISNIFIWFGSWLSTIFNLNLPDGLGGSIKLLSIFFFIFQIRIIVRFIKMLSQKGVSKSSSKKKDGTDD